MAVFLGQLPPTELARFKAELAETLIANFCYPRFFDYRSQTLRTRPVDRAKRQEVWQYLNTMDLSVLGRIDLLSADFQTQIERLFIQFVQRNRSFFGEQGRKRMADIRMLISSSSTSVVQGLRSHLTGQSATAPLFGSPRPVTSWASVSGNNHIEAAWEQIAPTTMLLQQQLQEVRGEIKPTTVTNEVRTSTRRPIRTQTPANPSGVSERQPSTASKVIPQSNTRTTAPLSGSINTSSFNAPWPSASISGTISGPSQKVDPFVVPVETPAATAFPPTRQAEPVTPNAPIPEQFPPASNPFNLQVAGVSPSATSLPATKGESGVLVSEEDIAIFEQMRHQLMVWLRIEAVRAGLEIAGQGPTQLLELLRQQDKCDETQLQVVSTLLNLATQVLKNGHASLLDYKQALMFHLMHTRRS